MDTSQKTETKAKGDAKVNCPKCGAPEREGTQPADASSSFYECGSICERGVVYRSWPCNELELLRSKLTPEGAEPLRWTQVDRLHMKSNCDLLTIRMVLHNNGEATLGGDVFGWFETVDAAKAHAEELHQKAFREFLEKWGKK